MVSGQRNIVDGFDRVHDYLRIAITERCNLRCFYCMPENGIQLKEKSHLMTATETITLARHFVNLGVKKIRLTGGEPLVNKNADLIIQELSRLNLELAITTNGILLDKYIDLFKECGLRSINVSLDTLLEEKFARITRRDYFKKVTSNIDLLLKNDFVPKINVVLIRGVNDDEIIDFINLTEYNHLHVRFIEFMPFDGNKWDWSKGVSYKELIKTASSEFNDRLVKIQDRPNDTSRNYRISGYKGTFAMITSVTNPFCDTCNRLRLTADGKMKNCLFSSDETDLLSIIRNAQNPEAAILEAVSRKKKVRAGLNSMEDFSSKNNHKNNRSMVLIGG